MMIQLRIDIPVTGISHKMGRDDQFYQNYLKYVRKGRHIDDVQDLGFSKKQVAVIISTYEKASSLDDLKHLSSTVRDAIERCKIIKQADAFYACYNDITMCHACIKVTSDKIVDITKVGTRTLFRRKGMMTRVFNAIFECYPDYTFRLQADNKYAVKQYERLGFKIICDDGGAIEMLR